MSVRAYTEYRDTGCSWLDKVPEHWRELPGIAVFSEKQVKNIGVIEKRVLSLSYGKIIIKPDEKLHGLVPDSFETYQIVEPGDIIIRATDLQNDKVSLRVGKVRDKGIITSAYLCLKAKNGVSADYAYLMLHTLDLTKVLYGLGSGLRQNLSWTDFKRFPFFIPSTAEQKKIIQYLDWKTSQINKFIKTKKRMIELLKEQKQVIIHNAVTGRIDVQTGKPFNKYKKSGIDWLEHIPEGWDIVRIKNTVKNVVGGATPVSTIEEFWNGDIIWITPSDISKNYSLSDSRRKISISGLKSCSTQLVPKGSIIMTCRAPVGNVGIAEVDLCTNQGCKSIIINEKKINKYFLAELIKLNQELFNALSDGSTFRELSSQRLKDFKIPYPPVTIQQKIVGWFVDRMSMITEVIKNTESEIDRLNEYRSKIISDVVTGKVDVSVTGVPEYEITKTEILEEVDEVELNEGNISEE